MNTIPDPRVPTTSDLARNRAQLLQNVATRPDARRRHRLTVGVVSTVVLLGGATAGALAISAPPMAVAHTAYCYSTPSTESRYTQVSGTDQVQISTNQGFLDACGAVWRADFFGKNQPGVPLPELGICLGRDDVVSIFPIEEGTDPAGLCKALGLREAPVKNYGHVQTVGAGKNFEELPAPTT